MTNNNYQYYCLVLSIVTVLFNLYMASVSIAEDDNEDTYSINLVQTAEVAKETVELENKKILTETYTAKEGDHIWQILRNRDLLKKNKLGGVLSTLKKLNPSLSNIDMIHPGEKIIIPLVITPLGGTEEAENISDLERTPLEDIENLEYYRVKSGDSLIRIINEKYTIPEDNLYEEYLGKLKKLNPDIKDLNYIYPGQKIRLPIYSPKIARGTIKDLSQKPKPENDALIQVNKEKGDHLKKIFTLIGEEWIEQGKHFIPLKTGGQIDLNTETYPVINLRNGNKVIVDLYNNLPDKMADLIRSNWDNYYIVHITENDDLMNSVGRVLSACGYDRVYTRDESLVFEEGFKIEITADWIIRLLPEASNNEENIICLNMTDEDTETLPSSLKNYLMNHGVKIIDYPEPLNKEETDTTPKTVNLDESKNNIIEKVLELAGLNYSSSFDIPIYKGEDADFNLIIKADYFFSRKGKDYIIELKDFGDDISSILKEHSYTVLTLSEEQDFYKLTVKILDFLGIDFSDNEHTFYVLSGSSKENIKLVIQGILFNGSNGQSNFFSSIHLNPDISKFLSTKVDNIYFYSS